jgi:hypothetical protein
MKEKDTRAVLQTSGSSMTFFNGIPPPLSSFFSMVRRAGCSPAGSLPIIPG